jgi:hypothetical protein
MGDFYGCMCWRTSTDVVLVPVHWGGQICPQVSALRCSPDASFQHHHVSSNQGWCSTCCVPIFILVEKLYSLLAVLRASIGVVMFPRSWQIICLPNTRGTICMACPCLLMCTRCDSFPHILNTIKATAWTTTCAHLDMSVGIKYCIRT